MIKLVKFKSHWGLKEGRFRNPLGITKSEKSKSGDLSVQR